MDYIIFENQSWDEIPEQDRPDVEGFTICLNTEAFSGRGTRTQKGEWEVVHSHEDAQGEFVHDTDGIFFEMTDALLFVKAKIESLQAKTMSGRGNGI